MWIALEYQKLSSNLSRWHFHCVWFSSYKCKNEIWLKSTLLRNIKRKTNSRIFKSKRIDFVFWQIHNYSLNFRTIKCLRSLILFFLLIGSLIINILIYLVANYYGADEGFCDHGPTWLDSINPVFEIFKRLNGLYIFIYISTGYIADKSPQWMSHRTHFQ